MYTYAVRTSVTSPGTALANPPNAATMWAPVLSLVPGGRAVRIRGIKVDWVYGQPQIYLLLTRRGMSITSSNAYLYQPGVTSLPSASVLPFTLDTAAAPLFTIYGPGSWGSIVKAHTDMETLISLSGNIGSTEWELGSADGLALSAYDHGCVDVQIASPTASTATVLTLFVEENPFRRNFDVAGRNTSSYKSSGRSRR